MPGYAGGETKNPTYEEVSSGKTGHAEVIRIEYDPEKIAYRDLLTVFFASHDPTTMNRQGNDVGTQYRSVVLYSTPSQKEEAEKVIEEINTSHAEGGEVVTEVKPLGGFTKAETEHINFYRNNPDQAYCQVIINPKLEKIQKKFANLLKNNS